jgi:predicted phosphoribosyltransferase
VSVSLFTNRRQAGRVLASALRSYAGRADLLVLALPRGGVPVAYEVARSLAAPLDVFVVVELGVPGHEEFAMGALAPGGLCVIDERIVQGLGIARQDIERSARRQHRELVRRERAYRGERPRASASGRTVILVDDGLVTGSTMRAAIRALREQQPAAVVAAVPVAAHETCVELSGDAEDVVCTATPDPFHAVSLWYDDFSQPSDEDVRLLLETAERGEHSEAPSIEM